MGKALLQLVIGVVLLVVPHGGVIRYEDELL